MKGLLFYDAVGARRNAWFIERLVSVAASMGCELLPIVTDDFDEAVGRCTEDVDFAIVRTISPRLTDAIEAKKIPVFNNSATARVANDKWQTYLLARELDISVMDTASLDSSTFPKSYPRVIKSVDGHGGSEVFLVKSAEECKELLSLHSNKRFISQELSSEPGVDMRVYVMGDSVIAATKRTSKSDFRSNFSLGGSAELDAPTEKMLDVISKIRDALKFDFVGVDFIRHNGEWVLNEIEDVVGTRMIYSLTDMDAAEIYIGYILTKMRGK